VLSGQTLVVNSGDAIYAVGVLTGRRLWARPYDVQLKNTIAPLRDRALAGSGGTLATLARDGYLSLLRLADGSTVWERDLRGESVRRIWMYGDRVITGDAAMTRALVFDRSDGRLVRRALFKQPNPSVEVIPFLTTGSVLCGTDSGGSADAVVGIDTETGKDLWRVEMGKPVVRLFSIAEGHLGVGLLGGDVMVIEAETGDVLISHHTPQGRAVVDGAYFEGSLILLVETVQGNQRLPVLVAMDIATGSVVWTRDDLAALNESLSRLQIVDGAIPTVVNSGEIITDGAGRKRTRNDLALAFVDARSGETLGEYVPLPRGLMGRRSATDVIISGDLAIIGLSDRLQAYRLLRHETGEKDEF